MAFITYKDLIKVCSSSNEKKKEKERSEKNEDFFYAHPILKD